MFIQNMYYHDIDSKIIYKRKVEKQTFQKLNI